MTMNNIKNCTIMTIKNNDMTLCKYHLIEYLYDDIFDFFDILRNYVDHNNHSFDSGFEMLDKLNQKFSFDDDVFIIDKKEMSTKQCLISGINQILEKHNKKMDDLITHPLDRKSKNFKLFFQQLVKLDCFDKTTRNIKKKLIKGVYSDYYSNYNSIYHLLMNQDVRFIIFFMNNSINKMKCIRQGTSKKALMSSSKYLKNRISRKFKIPKSSISVCDILL